MDFFTLSIIAIVCLIVIFPFILLGKGLYYLCWTWPHRIIFRKKIEKIAPAIREQQIRLDALFDPHTRTTKEEVDAFLSDNSELIARANLLKHRKYSYDDILETNGINKFLIDALSHNLNSRLQGNNSLYDLVASFRNDLSGIKAQDEEIFSISHYCAFSEMEEFNSNVAQLIDKALKIKSANDSLFKDEEREYLNSLLDIETKRKVHNENYLKNELSECKDYFDHVLGSYPLDQQQRDCIVRDEDNCLVTASAGSGKTSTILSKAKYLVERKHVDPSKILLITYTRKAALELQERMQIDGMTCCTFNALAYRIIGQLTGQVPSICNPDLPLNVFHYLIRNNRDFLHAVNDYVINHQSLMKLEHEYEDAFSYFEDRKKYGIQALFPDVDNRIIFTRSEEEKRLVSILTRLGVPFRYEDAYEYNTTTPERRQYRPDFTIYYPQSNGQWGKIYLEHFGVDYWGNVPQWFGDGLRGGWERANRRYNEGIAWKRDTHRRYGTILIETTSNDFATGNVEDKLRSELQRYGVPIRERSDEELFDMMVQRNRQLEKSVFTLILSFVTLMKANEKNIDGLLQQIDDGNRVRGIYDDRNRTIIQAIIRPFFDEYQHQLSISNEVDFTDSMIQATSLCNQGLWHAYEYILVDEFQDISVDRYKFLKSLRCKNSKTKLFCVGDDWQSIFRFAGSDMSLVYNFESYFGKTEFCKIETTYRFHEPLIGQSSAFIMKNKEQRVKNIKPPEGDTKRTYLRFEGCDGDVNDSVLNKVREIVASISMDQSIIILGRYNYDVFSLGFSGNVGDRDSRLKVNINGRNINFLSVHSAKGLEADNVILVNCNRGTNGFPSLVEDDPILDFVLSKSETYPFAEERRLFYVAMTRAKRKMYVLYDTKRPSPFISEFLLRLEIGSYLCPRCLEGKIEAFREGVTSNDGTAYRSFRCNNKTGCCDFFETKFGDLTPPGIKITEEMTAQDIERLREVRRGARHSPYSNSVPLLAMPPV